MILFINSSDLSDERVYYLDFDWVDKTPRLYTGAKDGYNYSAGVRTTRIPSISTTDTTHIYSIESVTCCNSGNNNNIYWNTIFDNWENVTTNYENLF
jgi:hypothetical protein